MTETVEVKLSRQRVSLIEQQMLVYKNASLGLSQATGNSYRKHLKERK